LRTPTRIAGETRDALMVRHYAYDPTLAPPGKTIVAVGLETPYDLWSALAREPEQYEAEKDAIAAAVMAALDERFPGLAAAVEVVDVATPMTWVRHTANWRGAYEGWLPTRSATAAMFKGTRDSLPGLAQFYMVGQWVGMGGLPSVAEAGRRLIGAFCKRDGKPFVTTIASHPPAHLLPDFSTGGHKPFPFEAETAKTPVKVEVEHAERVA
jgi:phytoene dehydrogenase-like protein